MIKIKKKGGDIYTFLLALDTFTFPEFLLNANSILNFPSEFYKHTHKEIIMII